MLCWKPSVSLESQRGDARGESGVLSGGVNSEVLALRPCHLIQLCFNHLGAWQTPGADAYGHSPLMPAEHGLRSLLLPRTDSLCPWYPETILYSPAWSLFTNFSSRPFSFSGYLSSFKTNSKRLTLFSPENASIHPVDSFTQHFASNVGLNNEPINSKPPFPSL